ncbi:MAG TPA: type II 3-dehydroquinate dehydratase [Dehalococcoidia bacterium]|nr:type II 3-dehydroquinate dehydratase [Dehalococcoidia bacterium]HIM17849.1 type II 3-dehydroquinate dehydratase [Dehalococcoidia bacterium]
MKILVINGPNLNNLGKREPGYYGVKTLTDIEDLIQKKAQDLDTLVEFFQSNHEGAIVDCIQTEAQDADGIVINAGALTHYGISLRDALADSRLPFIEVHLSNIHARETFRHHSVFDELAVGQIAGLGYKGYLYALEFLVEQIKESRVA